MPNSAAQGLLAAPNEVELTLSCGPLSTAVQRGLEKSLPKAPGVSEPTKLDKLRGRLYGRRCVVAISCRHMRMRDAYSRTGPRTAAAG